MRRSADATGIFENNGKGSVIRVRDRTRGVSDYTAHVRRARGSNKSFICKRIASRLGERGGRIAANAAYVISSSLHHTGRRFPDCSFDRSRIIADDAAYVSAAGYAAVLNRVLDRSRIITGNAAAIRIVSRRVRAGASDVYGNRGINVFDRSI